MTTPALVALDITGPSDPWAAIGLMVADDVSQIGDVTLRYRAEQPGWALRGAAGPADLDGIRTIWMPEPVRPSAPVEHELRVTSVDHVVVMTPDPARTFSCFESAGLVLRKERDAGGGMRQGFFRHGEAIVEVVGPVEVVDDGPASVWGITLGVEDLDAAVALIGPGKCGEAKDAVQPGRRIASLRREAELPVRVALMSS